MQLELTVTRYGSPSGAPFGLVGHEVTSVAGHRRAQKSIAYLNFDMLARRTGYFTYGGDQSLPLDARGRPVVLEGSAGISARSSPI